MYRRREQERLDRDRQCYHMMQEIRAKYNLWNYDSGDIKRTRPRQTPASEDIRPHLDKSYLPSSLRNMVSLINLSHFGLILITVIDTPRFVITRDFTTDKPSYILLFTHCVPFYVKCAFP